MMTESHVEIINLPAPDPELIQGLAELVGDKQVSSRVLDRLAYGRDIWPRGYFWLREGRAPYVPEAVVWARSTQEVSELLRFCQERRVPVTPAGAGSGVCGGAIPVRGGIVLDLKRMNRIIEINKLNHTVEVQAGMIGETLERELNRAGFSLGHFPSSMYCSTVGGWLAARSAGQFSSKYGKIEDMVVRLRGVFPDGTMFSSTASPRSAVGPDLDQLIVGSEGTLAVITRAMLAIHPLPGWSKYRGYLFQDLSAGISAIRRVMRAGLDPCVVRLYDELDTKLHEKSMGLNSPGCLLILGFEGPDNALTRAKAETGFKICAAGGEDLGPGPGRVWLERRYSVSYHQSSVLSKDHTILDTCEVSAVWSRLPALYEAIRKAILPHALVTAHVSHVYPTGAAIYFTFVSGSADPPPEQVYEEVWREAMAACLASGGSISHHHGIGVHKAKWMAAELGAAMKIYQGLKNRLDPAGILNPGKMGL